MAAEPGPADGGAVAAPTREAARRHRVIVVGAGFGGLRVARQLADVPVEISIIDSRNHHTFQPLLYQVATAGLDADDVCYATRGIFHRQANARAIRATVTSVDLGRSTVTLDDGETLPYDHLVLAAGGVTADFGVPGVARYGFGLKSAGDAIAIRTHVLEQFERCERSPEHIEAGALTLVVAGGGPTGVEMAGGFAELINHVLRRDFPGVDTARARVVLIEAADRLLGTFAPKLGRKAERKLERIGVEVLCGAQVAEVTATSVELVDGRSIPTGTLVWAAGIQANPLGASLGVALDRGGRVVVDEHLRLPDHPEVLVIGDLAAGRGGDGALLPQVAPVAIQAGTHAAEVIKADVRGAGRAGEPRGVEPFVYRDKGSMATIGRNAAVVELPGGQTMTGLPGWVAWLALHLVMLIGFRNRANVALNWAWNYLTYDRASRLIIEDRPRQERPAIGD